MKKSKKRALFIKNIKPRLEAIVIAFITTALIFFSSYLVHDKSVISLIEEIKIGLKSNADAAATTIDGDIHKLFNANTDPKDSLYLVQANALEDIRKGAQDIQYAYTNIMIDDSIYFIINISPQKDNDKDGVMDPPPSLMFPYPDASKELRTALKEEIAVVTEPYSDQYGTFISAYAPFYDRQGEFVGTLGMDLELDNFYKRLKPVEIAFEKTVVIIFFIGLVIGLLIWYIRKHAKSLTEAEKKNIHLLNENELKLTNNYTDQISVLKKIENTLLLLKPNNTNDEALLTNLTTWINEVKRYQISHLTTEELDDVEFDINELLQELEKSLTDNGIAVEITRVNYLIDTGKGQSTAYFIKRICSLIYFLCNINNDNIIQVLVEMPCEGIDDYEVNITLKTEFSTHFETQLSAHINPKVLPEDTSFTTNDYGVLTTINELENHNCTLQSFINAKENGFILKIKLNK